MLVLHGEGFLLDTLALSVRELSTFPESLFFTGVFDDFSFSRVNRISLAGEFAFSLFFMDSVLDFAPGFGESAFSSLNCVFLFSAGFDRFVDEFVDEDEFGLSDGDSFGFRLRSRCGFVLLCALSAK